jgi:general secretion pathway protein K
MKSVRQEKGMVLLMVLVVVALLTSLLTEFAFSTLVDMRLTETFRDSTRAYYLAKGGLRAGREMLKWEDESKQPPKYHHPNDMWAQGIANYPISDEGAISIQIEDLSGKLNINSLVFTAGNPNVPHKDRLVRLVEEFFPGGNSAEAAIDAIIDWIIENGPLNSLEELGLIEEFTPEMIGLMRPHITVYDPQGSGGQDLEKINVNTATAEVLMSLTEEMDQTVVEGIIALRNTGPIRTINVIRDLYPLVRRDNMSVTSSAFRITATAAVNDGTRTLEAVVDRTGNRLYYMKVH